MIIQIFHRDGTLENEITKVLSTDFSFSNILGSGQTSLSLDLDYKEWDLLGKFMKFFVDNRLVFSGQIVDEKYNFIGFTTITAYGLYDLFNTFQTRTPIDTYGGQISYLARIASGRYPFFEGKVDIGDSGKNPFDITNTSYINGTAMLKKVLDDSQADFFLGADGVVRFDNNISEKVHYLSIGQDAHIDGEIRGGDIGRSLKGYVSEAQGVETGGAGGDLNTTIKNDEESELWGRVSKNIWSESGQYSPIQLTRAVKNLLQSPPQKTKLEVKGDFWKYEVGDFVTIENSIVTIENVKIVKIDFGISKATLYLDDFSNIYKSLK